MTVWHRSALLVIAVGSGVVGLWALVWPRAFYDDFPGLGRVWVAVDGPYNEHLVRDVGGLQLAVASVAAVALVTGSMAVARAAGGAQLVFGVPHLLYHALNLDPFDAGDVAALMVSLTIVVVAGLVALLAPATPDESGDGRRDLPAAVDGR